MAENTSKLFKSLGEGKLEEVMKAYDEATSPASPPDARLNLIITVHLDTILHMAIYMRQPEIAIAIIGKCSDGDELLTKANEFGNTALHEAAATDDSSLVEELLKRAPILLSTANNRGEMPLYTAAYYGQAEIYWMLYERVKNNPNDLPRHLCSRDDRDDVVRSTVLHATVHAEFYELAYEIATNESSKLLVNMKDKNFKTCLHLLASNPSSFKSGNKWGPIKRFLYYCAPYESIVVRGEYDSQNEENPDDNYGESEDKPVCFTVQHQIRIQMSFILALMNFAKPVNIFVWKILRAWSTMNLIYERKKSHGLALKLAKLLIQADASWDLMRLGGSSSTTAPGDMPSGLTDSVLDSSDGGTSTDGPLTTAAKPPTADDSPPIPLFLATSHGILEIVKEILKFNAPALEYWDASKNQNVLHVAIMHRQLQIFDLVKKNKAPHSRLVRQIDYNGYTILHQVGNMEFYNGGTQSGPALQLQEELEWFEKVEKLVPPHYAMIRGCRKEENQETETSQQNANSATEKTKVPKSETPKEYFGRTHGQLLKDAQDWLKTTSESCSTVAGLMATVAFAAAFTVPGGNDDENGRPILLHSPFFLVFVITDALSLASSLTSLVMFLSILTSPFELDDFRVSLPRKLVLGFTFLFFSVAVSMLAFASTLMLTIPIKRRLTTTFVYFVAFLPVTMFALLQWPLYRAFKSSVTYSLAAIRSILPWHLISSAYTKAHTP